MADPAVLRAQLAEIRERGWAENFSETESEVGSVAAPIHDADGAVVAAISVVVPTEDLTRDSLKRYSRPCMDAAAAISRRLGYRPPTNERQQP